MTRLMSKFLCRLILAGDGTSDELDAHHYLVFSGGIRRRGAKRHVNVLDPTTPTNQPDTRANLRLAEPVSTLLACLYLSTAP